MPNEPSAAPDDVATHLMRISNLLALRAVEDLDQKDRIDLLNRVGYSNADAAQLLGTTADTVRVTLAAIKREKAQRRPKGKKAAKKAAR